MLSPIVLSALGAPATNLGPPRSTHAQRALRRRCWRAAWRVYHPLVVAERVAFPTRYVIAHISEVVRSKRLLARERARGLGEARAQHKLQRYRTFAENQLR